MKPIATYFMEDVREADRLEAKVDGRDWAERYLRSYLTPGVRTLCAGCGPGALLRGAADVQPQMYGMGIDISPQRVAEARVRCAEYSSLEIQVGDVQCLDLADESQDLVWSRFLLEYLPNKKKAVTELYRVLREGGRVLLQDLDGQLLWQYPVDEELSAMIADVTEKLNATGFDPFVGRKLFFLAQEAGFRDLKVSVEPYHLYAGSINKTERSLWSLKLDIARPSLEAILGESQTRKLIERFMAYLDRPDTLTYSVIFTVIGTK